MQEILWAVREVNGRVAYSLYVNVWCTFREGSIYPYGTGTNVVEWLNIQIWMRWTCYPGKGDSSAADWVLCRWECCRPAGGFCAQLWSYLAQNKGLGEAGCYCV